MLLVLALELHLSIYLSHTGNYGEKCLERTHIRLWWVFFFLSWPDFYTFAKVTKHQGSLRDLVQLGMMKIIAPLSGLVYFQTALRKKTAELTDWPEPKMEVRPLELAVNKLLSESRFLPLLVCFLGVTLLLQNVTSSLYFTSSLWFTSCLCFTYSLWFTSCNRVQMSFLARLNEECHLRKQTLVCLMWTMWCESALR